MEEKKRSSREIALIVMLVIAFGGFVFRLVDWQLIQGDHYLEVANQNNAYTLSTEAIRGEILDVNGVSLAVNFTGLKLYFDRFSMDEEKLNDVILSLIDLLEMKGEKWIDELPIEIDENGNYVFIKDKDSAVQVLKSKQNLNMNDYATADECMQKFCEKYKCSSYDKPQQRNIISVRYNMTKSGYDSSYTSPYTFADSVSSETVAIVSENAHKFPGVQVTTSTIRKDVNGTIAPHIVGIVGALSAEDYEELKDKGYKLNDRKGKSGIELSMEQYLRGKGGKKTIEVKKDGTVMNVLETQNATPGNTVYLTIDARLQKVANESLARNVTAAKSMASDCVAGGVVVMNVNDFSILAASTYPGYNLTKYLDDIKYYKQINSDPNHPTFDRAVMGAFTPGSIFKPAVACAGLQEGVISENDAITCNRTYYPFAGSDFYIKCMGTHGGIALNQALARSCNIYFAEVGRRLGIDAMNVYCKKMGLGVQPDVEIPATKGILAGREYSGDAWVPGGDLQAAIGQSDNMFSPLQLAVYTSTLANGGYRYRPHFVRKITDYNRQTVIRENDPNFPELVETLDVSPENLQLVKKGMRQVILSGTASNFSNYEIPIAAKTGTAENNGSDHTTFICFAPYEKPEIAIAVVIEHGAGGVYSKNVAKDILDAYFLKKGLDDIPAITSVDQIK